MSRIGPVDVSLPVHQSESSARRCGKLSLVDPRSDAGDRRWTFEHKRGLSWIEVASAFEVVSEL